jgi:hypothetical protein
MSETWRKIPSFPDYEASSLGRIRRTVQAPAGRRCIGGILATRVDRKGYVNTGPSRDCKQHVVKVHRLVAEAYLGKCPEGMQVNHIDGNKQNNAPGNLEYVTQSENIKHAYRLGLKKPLRGPLQPRARLRADDIRKIVLLEGAVSQVEIARLFGVDNRTISAIYKGHCWSHVTGRKRKAAIV